MTLNETEMLASLTRSGCLFGSAISKQMVSLGYFVETNQAITDPLTGLIGEIDLLAEYHEQKQSNKPDAQIKLAAALINTPSPVVLMNELNGLSTADIGETLKTIPIGDFDNLGPETDFSFHLFAENTIQPRLFTGYSSFETSDEHTAIRPEEMRSSIEKIARYCEQESDNWFEILAKGDQTASSSFLIARNLLFLPVCILNDDLFELTIDEKGNPALKASAYAIHLASYEHKGARRQALLYFVGKDGLSEFLSMIRKVELKVDAAMKG